MPQPPIPTGNCPAWNHTTDGYFEACGGGAGNVGQFSNLTPSQAQAACCANPLCAGFSFEPDGSGSGGGYYKGNALCGFTHAPGLEGWDKAGQVPAAGGIPLDITISFSDINLKSPVNVYDIWAQKALGSFSGSYTASQVPYHGTAFVRLTGS
jgi:hypothetical protein